MRVHTCHDDCCWHADDKFKVPVLLNYSDAFTVFAGVLVWN
ncbi:hypothetical protein QWZ13_09620 [Reinekea marina]|nr:hypothetical protein [Reinekea marina]MDN3649168.1 hypothetical protein [Reinekea marina]